MTVWNEDMDAAPKDGSKFLAWDAEGGCVCLVSWPGDEPDEDGEPPEWEVYELDNLDWISFGWHLTKWAPLPQPDWEV